MERPFADIRPLGPFTDYSITTPSFRLKDPDDYLCVVDLKGDVSEYSGKKSQFAQFVKSAFRDYKLIFSSYAGHRAQLSPFKQNQYLCKAKASVLPKPEEINEMLDKINDRVGGISAPEFRAQNIEFVRIDNSGINYDVIEEIYE